MGTTICVPLLIKVLSLRQYTYDADVTNLALKVFIGISANPNLAYVFYVLLSHLMPTVFCSIDNC